VFGRHDSFWKTSPKKTLVMCLGDAGSPELALHLDFDVPASREIVSGGLRTSSRSWMTQPPSLQPSCRPSVRPARGNRFGNHWGNDTGRIQESSARSRADRPFPCAAACRGSSWRTIGARCSPRQNIRRVIRGALAMTHTLRRLAEGTAGHGGALAMRLQQRSLWRLLAAVACSRVLAAAFRAVRAISFRIILRSLASSDASRSALVFANSATAISCSS
jgi:hypothetical protein